MRAGLRHAAGERCQIVPVLTPAKGIGIDTIPDEGRLHRQLGYHANRLDHQERLEGTIAYGPILIRGWRRMQARYEDGSDWYDLYEGLIADTRESIASLKEELKAMQSSLSAAPAPAR